MATKQQLDIVFNELKAIAIKMNTNELTDDLIKEFETKLNSILGVGLKDNEIYHAVRAMYNVHEQLKSVDEFIKVVKRNYNNNCYCLYTSAKVITIVLNIKNKVYLEWNNSTMTYSITRFLYKKNTYDKTSPTKMLENVSEELPPEDDVAETDSTNKKKWSDL